MSRAADSHPRGSELPFRASHVRVRRHAIDFRLDIPLPCARVDERCARRIQDALPRLSQQVCVGGAGERFGDEIVGTETAHLLEHVTLELMGAAFNRPFKGHTSWVEERSFTEPQGIVCMQVSVSYADDLVALQAFDDACRLVAWAMGDNRAPDPEPAECIDRLKRMIG